METSMPNAFAMGRSQKSATVCATRGHPRPARPRRAGRRDRARAHARDQPRRDGDDARELLRHARRLIAQFALLLRRRLRRTAASEEEEDIMIVILVSVLVYAISFLLLRALSRYREFAADRGSAVLTGRPSALASALLKISGTMERMPSQDLRKAEGMSAFFIIPARTKKSLMNIFSDHPPLEKRLAALSRLESQLQGQRAPRTPRPLAHGPLDALTGRHEVKGPARTGCSRSQPPISTLQAEHEIAPAGAAAIVFQALATSEFEATHARHGRSREGDRRRERHAGVIPRTTATATAGWCCDRDASESKTSRSASTPFRARSRRPATASGCCARCSPSRTRRAQDLLHLQLQARLLVPVRARPGDARPGALDRARAAAEGADGGELPIEPELERWFPLWGIPI